MLKAQGPACKVRFVIPFLHSHPAMRTHTTEGSVREEHHEAAMVLAALVRGVDEGISRRPPGGIPRFTAAFPG